jgi:hypothetical protein
LRLKGSTSRTSTRMRMKAAATGFTCATDTSWA